MKHAYKTVHRRAERHHSDVLDGQPLKAGHDASMTKMVQMRQRAGLTGDTIMAFHDASGGQHNSLQRKGGEGRTPKQIHAAAAHGLSGSSQPLPYLETIQQSFGSHDVTGIKAHVGGVAAQASQAMGARAYATGNNVAFAQHPDLHTAAHEAAHVVQQRAGVQLRGGVGQVGDRYEKHADAVADQVVQGKSAQKLLDRHGGPSHQGSPTGPVQQVVQREEDVGSVDLGQTAENGADAAGQGAAAADAVGADGLEETLTKVENKLRAIAPLLPELRWSKGSADGGGSGSGGGGGEPGKLGSGWAEAVFDVTIPAGAPKALGGTLNIMPIPAGPAVIRPTVTARVSATRGEVKSKAVTLRVEKEGNKENVSLGGTFTADLTY
ncbi:MAG: DUF4157 domain-containing protein, partial [Myxococcota bacterium]